MSYTNFTRARVFKAARFISVCLTALMGWASLAGRALCDALPPDPVAEFREALKVDRDPIRDAEGVRFRRANLTKKAEAIKSLGDISRALLLQEWRTDVKEANVAAVDLDVQEMLARKFEQGAKQIFARGTDLEKVAAANLIGETAAAARALGPKTMYIRQKVAVFGPDLVQLARSRSPRVREAAASAMGKIEPDPSYDELAGTIGGVTAAYGLAGQLADLWTIVTVLGDMLEDPKPGPRLAAAQALGNLVQVASQQEKKSRGSPRFNLAARNELVATSTAVLGAASKGLAATQPVVVRQASVDACRQITAALLDLIPDPLDPSAYPPPGRLLGPEERRRFIQERRAQELEAEEFRPLLLAFLANISDLAKASLDEEAAIRIKARHVIEELAAVRVRMVRREESIPKVGADGEALDGRDPTTRAPRETLQDALRKTISALVAGLRDTDPKGRLAAIDALETLESSAAPTIPQIVRRVRDSDVFVRWAAVRTLGKLAPAEADKVVPAVQDVLKDRDLDLRVAAATTLARFGPAASSAVDDLTESVQAGDPEIRIAAMRALEHIGTAAEPALPAVAGVVTHPNAQVRAAAAKTLARFGKAALFAEPKLRKALRDSDADVRRAASEALLRIHGK